MAPSPPGASELVERDRGLVQSPVCHRQTARLEGGEISAAQAVRRVQPLDACAWTLTPTFTSPAL